LDKGIRINSIRTIDQSDLSTAKNKGEDAMRKLSLDLGTTRASDDAAGIGISERMRSLIRSLDQASSNTLDGVHMAQAASSAMGDASNLLGRMRELAMQSSNGTLSDADRAIIDEEYQGLAKGLDDLGTKAEFNGQALLDGSSPSVTIQSGAEGSETIEIEMTELSAAAVGVDGEDLSSADGAQAALSAIDDAIAFVGEVQGNLGASVSTLQTHHAVLRQSSIQLSASESRMRDVDVAMETAVLVKQQILSKGSAAVLSQSMINAHTAQGLL
jgi:flagellin